MFAFTENISPGFIQATNSIVSNCLRMLDATMPAETIRGGRRDVIFFVGSFASIFVSSQTVEADDTRGAAQHLREVIVSHTDDQGVLQLFRVNEDGTQRHQLTDVDGGCRMPACSPDEKKLVYVRQIENSLSLWLSGIDGKDARPLTTMGMNLLPSWLPDSKHIVWMEAQPSAGKKNPAANSQLRLMNTETGASRRLFSDPDQIKFSNAMPSVSPDGKQIAFVSNRSGLSRVWVSRLDGRDAKMISQPPSDRDETLDLPIEQKVPAWSPDGKSIAHWEGVEMIHMSPFTGVPNPQRDRLISATFHVWVVSSDGGERRRVGRGDDPTWSPDGFVTRAFPDAGRGGPNVAIETDDGEKELPIVPRNRNWGRFTWLNQASR
ncbi:MAG: hypothetical protein AAF802_25740 [Planctomycetota bacterium]